MRFSLRAVQVREVLARRHWSAAQVAEELNISAGYWSSLLTGRSHPSAALRRRMLESRVFAGVPEDELWTAEGVHLAGADDI